VLEAVGSIVANFLQSIIIIIIQFDKQDSIVPNPTLALISMLSFLSKRKKKTSLITLPSATLRGR
jgi:hypothetical protein